jgi:lipopolysaccharide transport system permease protein
VALVTRMSISDSRHWTTRDPEGCNNKHTMTNREHESNTSGRQEPLIIEFGHTERHYWADVWRYRELLYFLAWRDISVRYKQTFFGIAWVVMRPLLTMLVFSIVFGKIAGLSSGHVPYPAMVMAAMLAWQLFASILADSGNSIVNNGGMISKVYFPRLLVPLSAVVVNVVDFVISAALLVVLLAWYGIVPDGRVFALPVFLLLALVAAVGAGVWISVLNVKYRDFRFVVAFAVQLGLYISPVGFNSVIIPEEWRMLYSLNPMVGVIDGFRWALLRDSVPLYLPGVLCSTVVALGLLVSAISLFRKAEKGFADDI